MLRKISVACFSIAIGFGVHAATPVYFHWNEVELVEGRHTIKAKLAEDGSVLEYLTIETPENLIELNEEELQQIKSPFLDTISFALMPYLIDGEYQYLYQLSLRYSPPAEQSCSEEVDGEIEAWAPERIFYVIFDRAQYKTDSTVMDCDG